MRPAGPRPRRPRRRAPERGGRGLRPGDGERPLASLPAVRRLVPRTRLHRRSPGPIHRTGTRSSSRCAGGALRSKVILRLIAADRAFHFILLLALAAVMFAIAANRRELQGDLLRVLSDFGGRPGRGRRRRRERAPRRDREAAGQAPRHPAPLRPGVCRSGHHGGRGGRGPLDAEALGRVPHPGGHRGVRAGRDLRDHPPHDAAQDLRPGAEPGDRGLPAVRQAALRAARWGGRREAERLKDSGWEHLEATAPPAGTPLHQVEVQKGEPTAM